MPETDPQPSGDQPKDDQGVEIVGYDAESGLNTDESTLLLAAALTVDVVGVRNLPMVGVGDQQRLPDPVVLCIVRDKTRTTTPKLQTLKATYNEQLAFNLTGDDMTRRLMVQVASKGDESNPIGQVNFPIKKLLQVGEVSGWYHIKDEQGMEMRGYAAESGQNTASHAAVKVHIRCTGGVKAVASAGAEGAAGVAHGGCREMVEVSVISAKHLPQMDALGTIDAYVGLKLGDVMKRTKVAPESYEPVWGTDDLGDLLHEDPLNPERSIGPDHAEYKNQKPAGEKFILPLPDGLTEGLGVRCLDWDFGVVGADDEVGTGCVPIEELRQLKPKDGRVERKVVLMWDGEPVRNGADGLGKEAFVLLKLRKVRPLEVRQELARIAAANIPDRDPLAHRSDRDPAPSASSNLGRCSLS